MQEAITMGSTHIFIAYAHASREDGKLCQKLLEHLKALPEMSVWHYEQLRGGTEPDLEVKEQLAAAQIILLLVSPSFLTSDDYQHIVTRAMEKHESRSARVIPILLRPCHYEAAPFARLQILPKDRKPVTLQKDLDEAFTTIVKDIQGVISDQKKRPAPVQTHPLTMHHEPLAIPDTHWSEQSPTWKERFAPFKLRAIQISTQIRTIIAQLILATPQALEQIGRKIKTSRRFILPFALTVLVFILILTLSFSLNTGAQIPRTHTQSLISNGTYPFDTYRVDGHLKQEAAQALKEGNTTAAIAFWNLALAEEPNDAETRIYIENQKVLASHRPYLSFIVAAPIQPYNPENFYMSTTGQDILQGAYIAQKEHNDDRRSLTKVRLLIANLGPDSQNEEQAVSQIIQSAKQEHIVGIIGQPFSSSAVVAQVNAAHIPMISSVEAFNNADYSPAGSLADECSPQVTTPYVFSITPTLEREGTLAALYAEQDLQAQNALLIDDPQNYYSSCLAAAFSDQFQQKDGKTLILSPSYTVGNAGGLFETIQAEESANQGDIKLIYFAGIPDDLCRVLPQIRHDYPDIHVMGADALYHLVYAPDFSLDNSLSSCLKSNFYGLYFTAFAFPDETGMGSLLKLYTATFDPTKRHTSTYGYSRIDSDAALSYDALHTFLQLSQRILLNSNKQSFSPEVLDQMLKNVTHDHSLPGASGQISFDENGNSPEKEVVFLRVETLGLRLLPTLSGGE